MVKMKSEVQKIQHVFDEVQLNTANHQKNLVILQNIYKSIGCEAFYPSFLNWILIMLSFNYKLKNPYVERICEFSTTFIVSVPENNEHNESFLEKLLKEIMKYHNAESDSYRYHLCEFVDKLMWKVESEFDPKLMDDVVDKLLERLRDIRPGVRVQAANALQHFQTVNNSDNRVTQAYIANGYDRNQLVRCAIVQNADISLETLPYFIERCRDTSANVRFAVYNKFLNVPVKNFKIIQRQKILKCGLNDDSKSIQKFVSEKLLPSWLEHYDNDYLQLIKAIQLDSNDEETNETNKITSIVLNHLFRLKTMRDIFHSLKLTDKLIPLSDLTWEASVFWKHLISHVRSNMPDNLEQILPDTVCFCEYVERYYKSKDFSKLLYWEQNQYHSILQQLVQIAVDCDISDTMSHKCLVNVCIKILKEADIKVELAEDIIAFLEKEMPEISSRVNFFFCELLSEIRCPLEEPEDKNMNFQIMMADLKVKLNCLMQDQLIAITNKCFIRAEELKNEITETNNSLNDITTILSVPKQIKKLNDLRTVNKCLDIAQAILKSPSVDKLYPSLMTFKQELCEDMVLFQNDPETMSKILKCYALYCYLDKASAEHSISMFSPLILSYRTNTCCPQSILLVSVAAMTDYIMLYGTDILSENNNSFASDDSNALEKMFGANTNLTEFFQLLTNMMDDAILEIRELACDVLLRLFMQTKIESPIILTRLIIKWFNPLTGEDKKIQQMLGHFLQEFHKTESAIHQLQEVFIPVVNTVSLAPLTSPLATVSSINVAKFLISITSFNITKTWGPHKNIALSICQEILKNPSSKICRMYSRILLLLDIDLDDEESIEEILIPCEEIRDDFTDRTDKRMRQYISKFIDNLKNGRNDKQISDTEQTEE